MLRHMSMGDQQPGTVFIAVGGAHLAGPDSLQQQLRNQGENVERL